MRKENIKSTFFNYRLSIASSVVLFLWILSVYMLVVHVKITWVDSNHTNKSKKNRFVSFDKGWFPPMIFFPCLFIKKFIFIMLKAISYTLKVIATHLCCNLNKEKNKRKERRIHIILRKEKVLKARWKICKYKHR